MAVGVSGPSGGSSPFEIGYGDGTTTADISLSTATLTAGRPLIVTWKARNTLAANSNVTLTFNNDTGGATYWNAGQRQAISSLTPGGNGTNQAFIALGFCCDTGAPAGAFATGYFIINAWDEAGVIKSGVGTGNAINSTSAADIYQDQLAGGWETTTDAITSVQIGTNSGFLDADSWVRASVL